MSIILTHPRIISFFETHTHINPEDIQLQVIDLLEKNAVSCSSINNVFQINELRSALSRFNETIQSINKTVLDACLTAKSQYVLEYNTATDAPSLLNNHQQFAAKIQSAIFSIIHEPTLKIKYPALYDKLVQLTKQFVRIMETNMLTSMSVPTKYKQEYVANFETNAGHMVQSIQTIFTDFASAKDTACNTIIGALSANADGAMSSFSRIQYELADFVRNTLPSSSATQNIELVIHRAFPTASNIYSDDDNTVVICREGVPDIHIASFAHKDRNVNSDEIRAAAKQCQANGIIVSQNTGISGKPNYHIDIQNHHVIVYIHCAQYSADKIQLAVDMIDSVYAKLGEIITSPEYRESIPKETLDDINREYQHFIVQKETFAQLVKDTHRKMTAQLDDFRFPALDRFLCTRYSSCKKQGYTCDLCSSFNVGTLKGLAAHKRGCQRKMGVVASASK
jgi:hypothetical protein